MPKPPNEIHLVTFLKILLNFFCFNQSKWIHCFDIPSINILFLSLLLSTENIGCYIFTSADIFSRGKPVITNTDVNFVTVQRCGRAWHCPCQIVWKKRVEYDWSVCVSWPLLDFFFLSELFSKISRLCKHVVSTFCPVVSAVLVFIIAWGRTRGDAIQMFSVWLRPAHNHEALPELFVWKNFSYFKIFFSNQSQNDEFWIFTFFFVFLIKCNTHYWWKEYNW